MAVTETYFRSLSASGHKPEETLSLAATWPSYSILTRKPFAILYFLFMKNMCILLAIGTLLCMLSFNTTGMNIVCIQCSYMYSSVYFVFPSVLLSVRISGIY